MESAGAFFPRQWRSAVFLSGSVAKRINRTDFFAVNLTLRRGKNSARSI
jgi:hypothetical protein